MKHQNLLQSCARVVSFSWKQNPAFEHRFSLHVRRLSNTTYVSNNNAYSNNRIINDLVKSGSLDDAVKLFGEMSERDVITWNIMISGHYRCGFLKESLSLYRQMVFEGFVENSSTFSTVLSMCNSTRLFREGREVHCRAIVLGVSKNVYIGCNLVDLYLRMGLIEIGLRLFSTLQERNLVAWNVVLRGLCEIGRSRVAKNV